jgi:aspartate kinase
MPPAIGQRGVHDNLALIATVGRGLVHYVGVAAKLFSAWRSGVNVSMIDQAPAK